MCSFSLSTAQATLLEISHCAAAWEPHLVLPTCLSRAARGVSRAGEFQSYWVWEPVLAEVGGREQQLVHITAERSSGEHLLAV